MRPSLRVLQHVPDIDPLLLLLLLLLFHLKYKNKENYVHFAKNRSKNKQYINKKKKILILHRCFVVKLRLCLVIENG